MQSSCPLFHGHYHSTVPSSAHLSDVLANAITHGIGLAFAVVGAVFLIAASTRGSALVVVSCTVFSVALVLVYLCSTLYHSLGRTRARHVLHVLDHSAIYVLIAATYTPFTLVSLRGPVGWALFAVVWALAVAGIVFKSLAIGRFPVASPWCIYCRAGSPSSSCDRFSTPLAGTDSSGSPRAASPIPSASSSSRSTIAASSTPHGTSSCSPGA